MQKCQISHFWQHWRAHCVVATRLCGIATRHSQRLALHPASARHKRDIGNFRIPKGIPHDFVQHLLLDFSDLIASDAFTQRARHPSFPKAFTRGRKLPLPALIAALLSMRAGSRQTLLDTFFTNLQASVGGGGEMVRGVSDRAFAKARSHLHMPALNWLNDWVIARAETAGIVKRWRGVAAGGGARQCSQCRYL
jgi:hypothetical protein